MNDVHLADGKVHISVGVISAVGNTLVFTNTNKEKIVVEVKDLLYIVPRDPIEEPPDIAY